MNKEVVFAMLAMAVASSCDDDPGLPINTTAIQVNEVYTSGPDWIELYNRDETPNIVGGFLVYDDPLNKYSIPAGTSIPSKGYIRLLCTGNGSGLETSFRLDADGETIYLEDAAGQLLEQITLPQLKEGQSFAKFPDGNATLFITGLPTPEASNGTGPAPYFVNTDRIPKVVLPNQAVTIVAEVESLNALASVVLSYRYNGAPYQSLVMTESGGNHMAVIPGQSLGEVDYYMEATNSEGLNSYSPYDAPSDAHDYILNNDPLPTLFINEILASNTACCPDTDSGGSEFDDWIEIYNPGSTPVNLSGMYVSDNQDNPFNSRIPDTNPSAVTVPAGGYLVFWADGEQEQGVRHLGFRLSSDGEDVALYYIDGRTIDLYSFGPQIQNISFGRSPDGSATWKAINPPTPGGPN